ncbi:MAG: hypothetical protein M3004_00500 [Bacteroidota bacterium]|nr:hypothetical protein [Bacteroidota bacterium]
MVRDLTNGNFKYWYRYSNDTSKPYAIGYCFYKNGTFIEYNNDAGSRLIFHSPVLSKPYWKLINDTTMMFGEGDLYKIMFFNGEDLILRNLKIPTNDSLKLHRDRDQYTKPH